MHAAAGTCYFGLFENVMIGTFGGLDIVIDPYTNGSTGVVTLHAKVMASGSLGYLVGCGVEGRLLLYLD